MFSTKEIKGIFFFNHHSQGPRGHDTRGLGPWAGNLWRAGGQLQLSDCSIPFPGRPRRRELTRALPAMYGTSDPTAAERTAFRRAEKQYKLYKTLNVKGRSRSRSGCRPSSGEGGGADLSAVVDFHALLAADGELPDGIGRRECPGFDRPVFCFLDRPGNCDLLSILCLGLKLGRQGFFFH